jgi:predicted TIM-barrel fold metal-dependent hydrolase
MATRVATKVVDGDGHIFEDHEGILAHMSSPYREIAQRRGTLWPPLDHLHDGRAVETPPMRDRRPRVGPEGWLAFLDDVGIDWTVLYPTTALAYGKIVSLDYAVDVTRAYNDWLHETYLRFSPRFKAMAIIPLQDPEEAVKELRRAVTELGMLGAMMPSNGLPQPLGSKPYWPIYAEAERLGCSLAIHGGCHDRFGLDHLNMYVPVHALGHPWGLTINCASVVYNGIFDRFPGTRLAFLEGGIAWLLLCLERFHSSHETHFQHIPADQYGPREGERPDQCMIKHIREGRFYIGCETEELTLPFALKVVGNQPWLYSSDFPHEVTNQSCKHDIEELLESDELTQADKEAILARNAERFYRL